MGKQLIFKTKLARKSIRKMIWQEEIGPKSEGSFGRTTQWTVMVVFENLSTCCNG
jgi:hypothetical protein